VNPESAQFDLVSDLYFVLVMNRIAIPYAHALFSLTALKIAPLMSMARFSEAHSRLLNVPRRVHAKAGHNAGW